MRPLPAALLLVTLLSGNAATAAAPPVPIPQDPGADQDPFLGAPAEPRPVQAPSVPQHPFMAPNGLSNIHNDPYMTDTYEGPGPLGREVAVRSTFHVAECASVTFDRRGRILTICLGVEGPRLVLMDPRTLATEAVLPLPPRQGGSSSVFTDFAGGGYFYLDQLDRAVIPTNDRRILVVAATDGPGGPALEVVETHDLSGPVALGDGIVSALPDWSGLLWFVTTRGVVGTVNRETGEVLSMTLDDEAITNSFAVDDTGGVFIVSDHALYRFDAGADGAPAVTWREPYDRGVRQKPGQVGQGSGTTPTLMGKRYVAITDNADPRMHVLAYRRGAEAPRGAVCSQAVFAPGESATDNSLIGTGRSMVVENNYGYGGPATTARGSSTSPGLARVDLNPDGDGCRVVWTSEERAPSVVPKLSLANGLVYAYTQDPDPSGEDRWYLTAISFRTGRTVWERLAGEGLGFNNNYAPVTLGPDGSAYVGALGGLVLLRDG
jgi:hypothetical protein